VTTGTDVEGIFSKTGSEKRVQELKLAFDSPPRYGKGIYWADYTVHDAARIMLLYLEQLPEPVIPLDHYERFCEPLRHHQFDLEKNAIEAVRIYQGLIAEPPPLDHYERFYEPPEYPRFDLGKNTIEAVRTYQGLIAELPPLNRQLFLYVLDLLAVFASEAEINKMSTNKLADIFQKGLLRSHRYDSQDLRINQGVLFFLIENQDSFLLGMPGTALDDEPVQTAQNLTDTIELGELAPQGVLPNDAPAYPPPPVPTISPDYGSGFPLVADMSSKHGDRETSGDVVPVEDRTETETEVGKEALDVDSTNQRNRLWVDTAILTGDLVRRALSSRKQTKLAMHDQQRAHDSKFENVSRSPDIDTSHPTADAQPSNSPSRVREPETTSSATEPNIESDEEHMLIENVAQKRAESGDLSDDYVLFTEKGSVPEPTLEEVRDHIVMRNSKQLLPTATSDPDRNLSKRLGHYFVEGSEPRVEYSESEIVDISQLLLRLDPSWSRIPRVYIVLRIIDCLHAMSTFVDVGFSDYDFPVTARSLPPELNPKARSDFVKNQSMVMTKSLNLEKREGGQHCFFKKNEYLPLRGEGILGVGGFGQVDKVLSLISFKKYARKRVLRTAAFGGRNAAAQRAFIKEIEILKRLKHWHIVEFVGSYTDHKYIGVLMEPIADMDLATYLERADQSRHRELRTFFGCLSRALEFLHEQNIRHKDIKPQNVLYEAGRGVLFTDFGLALDFTEASRSTTMGMVNGMTPMYCAPEVAAEEPRSTSSDIYSLGIVFLEMIVVLKGHSIGYMRAYFEAHGSKNWLIRKNNEALDSLLAELGKTAMVSDNKVLTWIEQMLQQDQKLRPTAASLLTWCSLPDENGIRQFSGICCLSPDESFSEASDDYWDDGSDPL
jgi:hypothetical protein